MSYGRGSKFESISQNYRFYMKKTLSHEPHDKAEVS